jgi:hypothetical protein
MSKKNNKSRKKKYIEKLKEIESNNEKEAKERQMKREANIEANKLLEDIEDINLDGIKKEKMDIEKKTRRKKRVIYRSDKKSRYN